MSQSTARKIRQATGEAYVKPAKVEPDRHHESRSDRRKREATERANREAALKEMEDA